MDTRKTLKSKQTLLKYGLTRLNPLDDSEDEDRPESESEVESDPEDNMSGSSATLKSITNPYFKDIDLETSDGIKLFTKAIEGPKELTDKFDMSQSTVRAFRKRAIKASKNFNWGKVVSSIDNGAGEAVNLLTGYSKLSITNVVSAAHKTWGIVNSGDMISEAGITEADVQRRIRSVIIARWCRASMTSAAETRLDLDESKFQYEYASGAIEDDGPTMLKIIFDRVNPSTRIGVKHLEQELENITLGDFDQDVIGMLDEMQKIALEIEERYQKPARYEITLFDALLSGTNDEFKTAMMVQKNRWDDGDPTITADSIRESAIRKVNNMAPSRSSRASRHKQQSIAATTLHALTTKIAELEQKLSSPQPGGSYGKVSLGTKKWGMAEWRMTKSFGEQVTRDGIIYYWCPHHKVEGKYNGLYMTHPPSGHDEWQRKKDYWKAKKMNGGNGRPPPAASDSEKEKDNKKLVLTEKMRTALMTNHGFNELQYDSFLASIEEDF